MSGSQGSALRGKAGMVLLMAWYVYVETLDDYTAIKVAGVKHYASVLTSHSQLAPKNCARRSTSVYGH